MRHLAGAAVVALTAASPAAGADVGAVTEAVIVSHIQPSYERLASEFDLLTLAIDDLCTAPGAPALAAARAAFGEAVAAWSRIAHIRFGPVAEDNRYERIHFWPDRRGIGVRQTRRLIAAADETLLDPARLMQQSVAVQGLGALEIALFDAGADDLAAPGSDGYRCRYAHAVALRLAATASAVDRAWADDEGFAMSLRRPGPDNPLYRDDDEVLAEYVGTLAQGFEALRDLKLIPVLGADAATARPGLAVFRRSQLGRRAVVAELAGLAHMFEVSGLGLALSDDDRWMGAGALFEFRNATRTLDAMAADLGVEVADVDGRGRLTYLVIVMRSLQRLIGEQIATALGLTMGFSSLDGD